MSRLDYLVRDPISFVGFPWRTTVNLVRGRVFAILYHSIYKIKLWITENESKTKGVFRGLHSAVLLSTVSILENTLSPQKCFLWGGGNVFVSWLDYISFRVRPEAIFNRDMNETRPISWVPLRFQTTLRWNHWPVPKPHSRRRAHRGAHPV